MIYKLINIGEIRFGPQYFKLYIGNTVIQDRIFGSEVYESKSKKFLVFQEWMTIDYTMGPATRPFIVDVENLQYYELSSGKKGFTENFKIESNILTYDQVNKSSGFKRQFECNLDEIEFKSLK